MQGLIAIMLDFISIVRQFCLSMIETGYRHFGNRRSNGLFILLLIPVLQSCSGPRAVTGMAVPENQLIKASVQVPFLVASTRQRAADMNAVFTRDRAESVKFSRVDVRIPSPINQAMLKRLEELLIRTDISQQRTILPLPIQMQC